MDIKKFVLAMVVLVAGALMPWAHAANEVHNITKDTFHNSIQAAVTAATAGDTLVVEASLSEGLVVVNKNLTLQGLTGAEVIKASTNTSNSGDGKAWFLVNANVNLQVRNLTFDGDFDVNSITISQAFRHKGSGKFVNCTFRDIRFQDYVGTAIVAFGGNVDVDRCTFTEIERVGVLFFDNGITNAKCVNSNFLGLGNGDLVNYGVEVNAGAVVEIRGNSFDDYSGIATSDDSTSAGVLVTSEGGVGTAATLTGNVFTDCTFGLAVGFLVTDTSQVDAQNNRFEGNTIAVGSFGPTVNAPNNWWGDESGPDDPTGSIEADGTAHIDPAVVVNDDGVGDAVTDVRVDYTPWLTSDPDNSPPTANDDGFEVLADTTGNILLVLANDTALPDTGTGETLTVQSVGPGNAGGTISVTAGSLSVTYTPLAGFTGIERFTYTLSDGNGGTDTASVDVSVVASVGGNSPPVAQVVTPPTGSVNLNGGEDFEFVVNATDGDGDTLTYNWQFGDGTQTSGIELTNVLHAFAPGTYTITVTVTDGNGGSDSVQIQVTVVGGVDDADLYVAKAAFGINWKVHAGTGAPKDTISFAGNLNPAGMPLIVPGTATVQVRVNDTDVLGGAKALDAKGTVKGVVGAAAKFSFKVSPKNGKYAFKISGADLRTPLSDVEDVLEPGATVPVRLGLLFLNTGLDTFSYEGQPEFFYTTKAGSSSKGKFSFKTNPLLSGAYTALKTSAKESKLGGEHLVTSKGVLELGGGGPVVPDSNSIITLEIGTKSITFNSNLLVQSANNLTLPKDAVQELTFFNLNNPKKTFAFKTAANLGGTGIPNAGSGGAAHDLVIRLTMVIDGESVELDTAVEILRKDNNSKSWKR